MNECKSKTMVSGKWGKGCRYIDLCSAKVQSGKRATEIDRGEKRIIAYGTTHAPQWIYIH